MMNKKLLKYSLLIVILSFVVYNAVYFKKLDQMQASASKQFDAPGYANDYFNNKLLPLFGHTEEINQLILSIKASKNEAFEKYGHSLGIGNIKYFLVRGEGHLTSINENTTRILVKNDSCQNSFNIVTEFVYGNAIRDASGLINLNEFSNTMDFNNVSAGINKIVRTEVLPAFKSSAKIGNDVRFFGAIELNKEHPALNTIEIIPISLKVNSQKSL